MILTVVIVSMIIQYAFSVKILSLLHIMVHHVNLVLYVIVTHIILFKINVNVRIVLIIILKLQILVNLYVQLAVKKIVVFLRVTVVNVSIYMD